MNPLDPILDAYRTALDAMNVVRRCATLEAMDEDRPFRNTRFHARPGAENLDLLQKAEDELNDLTVLSLYATFENQIRVHVAAQGRLLQPAAGPAGFGPSLAGRYEEWASETFRMDHAVRLFETAVNAELLGQVGQVRTYRHWIAHGRHLGSRPPGIQPRMAYDILTRFLTMSGLIP